MSPASLGLIPSTFSRIPSQDPERLVQVVIVDALPPVDALGIAVAPGGDVPPLLGLTSDALESRGFRGEAGQTLVIPRAEGPDLVAVGVGPADERTASVLRDVTGAFVRSASRFADLALDVVDVFDEVDAEVAGRAIVEGAVLARYRYTALKTDPKHVHLASLYVVSQGDPVALERGAARGTVFARAETLSRDLANTPPSHLTATDLGVVAETLGDRHGLEVEVFDRDRLIELGCGGLLGVNAGSAEEPRMIQLRYTPTGAEPTAHLALVGKGIMYDSGGISLKPSDPMHLAMKMDMAGAGAVLAAMTVLGDLECPVAVSAYLMCTDNMPSGSATKLGDVLTIRGGTTVEVKNTDAEGRLVLADALVLAAEESPDAIVDIATLTGAALMALGTRTAPVHGTDQALVDQAIAAGRITDEPLWQLPLERRYRKQLDSDVADISNMGGIPAGSTIAALFLADFVGDIPWAHLDIAGTMQVDADDAWRSKGATGFGARLLAELALSFRPTRGEVE